MKVTLRQMHYFTVLAEQRNFRRAASVLNISQPALSIQIKEMEDRLGTSLVERGHRDVIVTTFGKMILSNCLSILHACHEMEHQAKWYGGLGGRLVMGVIPTIAPYLLPSVLEQLRAQDLRLDLQIQEAKTENLISALRLGDIDVAIMANPVPADDLEHVFLFQDRFLLAGTQTRLAQYPSHLSPRDLSDGQLLLLEDGNCLTDQSLEVCGRPRNHPQINMGATSMATLTRLVAAGFGVTLIPELAAHVECETAQDLTLRRFGGQEPARDIALFFRKSTPRADWLNALQDVLARCGNDIIDTCRRRL